MFDRSPCIVRGTLASQSMYFNVHVIYFYVFQCLDYRIQCRSMLFQCFSMSLAIMLISSM